MCYFERLREEQTPHIINPLILIMRVTILGSGSAIPVAERAQSGVLLEGGWQDEIPLLVDCGSGVLHKLTQASIGPEKIKTIFLTHHHLDHMSDLLPLITARWLLGHTKTRIYGPEGTQKLIKDLLDLYEYVKQQVSIYVTELKDGSAIEVEGMRVECLQTVHSAQNLAYKFENEVVISGDTEPFERMGEFAKGCKLLIHECSFPDGFKAIKHTTPAKLGEVLKNCDVETLVLTHLYPPMENKEREIIESVRKNFRGKVFIARDLARFEV